MLTDRLRVFSFDRGEVPDFQADSCHADTVPHPFEVPLPDVPRIPPDTSGDARLLEEISSATSDRWIATRGDTLLVLVVYQDSLPLLSLREAPRQPRWRTDLDILARLALMIATAQPTKTDDASAVRCARFSYALQLERSNLELRASARQEQEPDLLAHKLMTGPSEHWYLSADIPFSALRYDGTKFDSVKNPAVFYLGLNYLFGDLLSEDRPSGRNLGVKGVVRLSRDPLESLGLAVTYRGSLVHGIPGFETISPFVGVISSRREKVADEPADSNGDDEERKWEVVFGAGFNLDKALEWVK